MALQATRLAGWLAIIVLVRRGMLPLRNEFEHRTTGNLPCPSYEDRCGMFRLHPNEVQGGVFVAHFI